MSSHPLLRVEGLTKTFRMYHLDSMLHAFEGVSFDLHEGEFLLLRGHNGAGKSTLLRTIWRSYLPVGGHVWYRSNHGEIDLANAADVDIALLRREEIGFVTQFLNARPRVAAQDIVAEPLRLAGSARPRPSIRPGIGWSSSACAPSSGAPIPVPFRAANSRRSIWPAR
jgi:alpha-D-ribose 1-methylphosphonate 5-triphosphate synthase subunit PhnL